MNESLDRMLDAWLLEGPERGPEGGLDRAFAASRRTSQRPAWFFLERWLPMVGSRQMHVVRPLVYLAGLALLIGLLLGGAVLAGSALREDGPPIAIVDNAPIPPPADMQANLDKMVRGWGYGWREVSPLAPPPRISPEQATRIAGASFLNGLRMNDLPAQDVTVPDGLIRREFTNTLEGQPPVNVWVVFFEADSGYDCISESGDGSDGGGPGSCRLLDAIFVDDKTGAIVSGFSLTR